MPDGDAAVFRPAIIWRSLPLRLAIAAFPAWLTISILVLSTPWRLKLLIGAVAAITAASPALGLVVFSALAPLGELIAVYIGLERFRITEALAIAFLCAFIVRPVADRPGPRAFAPAGWLLSLVVLLSVAAQAWQIRGEVPLLDLARTVVLGYFIIAEPIGLIAAARLIEGVALTAVVLAIFRRHPRVVQTVPAALVGAAAVAAVSSVLLWRGIGPQPLRDRLALIGYRVSAHVGDVNAAGSHFALVILIALGIAMRTRGLARAGWLAGAATAGVGLWFSESRSAMAATGIVITLAAVWRLMARTRPRTRYALLALAAVIGLAVGSIRARRLELDPTFRGAGFRQQFNATSARMMAARPLSGIGIGQYYTQSPLFLAPQLAFAYGSENAHNYFLQVGGELGIPGLIVFLLWIGAPLAFAARALHRDPRDVRLLGFAGGALAVLGTCLTGHPLLVDPVALTFWIALALTSGLADSALRNDHTMPAATKAMRRTPSALQATAAAFSFVVVAGALFSVARGPVTPPNSGAVDGFYGWETGADGTRYRWTEQYASVFVPASVTRVYLPVRMPATAVGLSPMGIEVRAAGIEKGRSLIGTSWATLNVVLPDVAPPLRFKRIDLRVDRTWQPAVYLPGSGDMRLVGMQVGEARLFHEY